MAKTKGKRITCAKCGIPLDAWFDWPKKTKKHLRLCASCFEQSASGRTEEK